MAPGDAVCRISAGTAAPAWLRTRVSSSLLLAQHKHSAQRAGCGPWRALLGHDQATPGATGHHTPRPHGEAACQLQGATREPLVAKFLPNVSPESLSAARRHPIRTGQALPGGANTMDSPPTAAIMHFTESSKLRFKKLHASNVSEEY